MLPNGEAKPHGSHLMKNGFKYGTEDELTVEFNPIACTITYSNIQTNRSYVQPLNKEHLRLGPIHFCADLWG